VDPTDLPETLARAEGVLGELVLRRRPSRGGGDGEVYELIVNGVFLMDTVETSTEDLLGQTVLDRHPTPRDVLVGGLGLGFTVAALLADPRVERVDVVEIEPELVSWLRSGLVPAAVPVLADPRVHVEVANIRDVLADAEASAYDAILLDVDNGPDFLVHDQNAAVYSRAALADAVAALRPSGMLAVWSAAPSAALHDALADVAGQCDEITVDVEREGRPMTYYLYLTHAHHLN
jgi:spermidine synthase